MKQAQQLQERLSQVQDDVARRTVEASAGGGMVSVVVNGKHELLSVTHRSGGAEARTSSWCRTRASPP